MSLDNMVPAMPRSDITRSNRPGLIVATRVAAKPRMPRIASRAAIIQHHTEIVPQITHVPKITHVPQINLSGAIRHLTYHIWATKHHDIWKWNIGQLAERWHLFNGKKCLGIVYDENSHDPDTVLEFCHQWFGIEWDFVFSAPNDPTRGELVTWHPKMEFLLSEFATQDDVVFNAHAKGVKYEEANTNINWTTVMYETNLDNWGPVRDQLEHKGITGCFRLKGGSDGFRYAGTFYWYRLSEVKDGRWKDIHPDPWGAEDWPARHFHWNASGCLFGDNETLQDADAFNKSFYQWRAQKRK